MTEREQRVNRDLRALDEACRAGRIAREEYRRRRRALLATLGGTERVHAGITLRRPARALVSPAAFAQSRRGARAAPATRPGTSRRLLALAGLGLGLLLAYWLWPGGGP